MKHSHSSHQFGETNSKHKLKKATSYFRFIILIAIVLMFFVLGIFVGNGRINGTFRKLQTENKNLPNKLDVSSVQAVYQSIKDNYDGRLDQSKLLDGVKSGLAQATGDPYTVYLNPTQAKLFSDQLNGTFTGIGAELGKDDKNNLIVISPIAGFPAEKSGLKSKDIIAQINGQTTSGMSIDDAVTKIRGAKGTTVTLDIIRDNNPQLRVSIVRDDIKVPSVNSKILDGNIGYLQITQFSEDTSALAKQAAEQFKTANVKGVILDLRGDPGGLLDAAVNISSLWLNQGKIVLLEKRNNIVDNTYTAIGGDVLNGIPTVVLIDGGSASASEITAGALRDNNAARLIGEKSFGKGSVQQIVNLGDGSELKITIAHWFTPSGKSINKTGITPDQLIKISDSDIKAGNDSQKQTAIDYLNNK